MDPFRSSPQVLTIVPAAAGTTPTVQPFVYIHREKRGPIKCPRP